MKFSKTSSSGRIVAIRRLEQSGVLYCVGKHFCFIFLGLKSRVSPERNNQHPVVSGVNGRNLRLAISIYVLGGGGSRYPSVLEEFSENLYERHQTNIGKDIGV